MHYGLDIGPHFIHRQMHGDFAGAFRAAGNLVPLHIDNNQIVDVHHPFANARRGRQNPFGVHADGDIAVVGSHPAFLEHQLADADDILAMFALRLHHEGHPIVANQ